MNKETLIEVKNLTHRFSLSRKIAVNAVNDVSFQIYKGEILGLVGESGSGKSTIARCLMNIYAPTAGKILYKGINIHDPGEFRQNKKLLQTRRQIIFQDSASSLNPRMKAAGIIAEKTLPNPMISACIFILFFLRIAMVQIGVNRSMEEVAGKTAICGEQDAVGLSGLVLACNARMKMIGTPTSYIRGGILGISYDKSSVEDNYITLVAEYGITFPIRIFGTYHWNMESKTSWRKWIGWDPEEDGDGHGYVYVTKEGSVYHERYDCTYLHPSIHAVAVKELDAYRNTSGNRYKICRSCKSGKKKEGTVYITDYGDSYHSKLSCGGLKRTIYRKRKEDVLMLAGCSKCSMGK